MACRRIGEQLGINTDTLRGWVKQAQIDTGGRSGTTVDAARIRALEQENAELRRANADLAYGVGSLRGGAVRHEAPCVSRGGERPSSLGRRSGLMKLGAA
jgi:transposase-like protein